MIYYFFLIGYMKSISFHNQIFCSPQILPSCCLNFKRIQNDVCKKREAYASLFARKKLFFLFLVLLCGLDDFLCILSGNFFIALEAHGEGAAALGHGAKVGCILEHFALRNLSGYALLAVHLIHTHDAAATLVHVADDVAHVLVGNHDLYMIDGLEEDRGCLIQLLERKAGSGLERHFRGVNGMVGTVMQFSGETYYREACENTLLDVVAKALFNCGDEVARYNAADNCIFEDELGVGGIVVGTEFDNNVTELTMSAGLLLVAAANVDLLADGLTVRNFGILQDALYAELGSKLLGGNFDVQLAQTAQQGLGGLNILGDGEGRVFFDEAVESGEDLVFFAGLLGVNCHGDAGSRELDVGKLDGLGGVAKGVTGCYGAELGQSADVAGNYLGGSAGLLAEHEIDGAGLLSLFGVGIVKVGIGGKNAGIYLDQRKLTYEGVSKGLEDLSGEGLIVGTDAGFLVAGLGVDACDLLIGGRRHELDDHIENVVEAYAIDGVAAYNGNNGAFLDALSETEHGVFGGKLHFLEELLHELLISASGCFHESFAGGFDFACYGIGNGDLFESLAFAGVSLVGENVGNTGELSLFNDRNHDGSDVAAVLLGDGTESLFEVGVFTGHVVDNNHAGRVVLVTLRPGLFGADIEAAYCANGDQSAFASGEGAHHFAGKIKEAGNVYKVDLGFLILQRSKSSGDGNLAANFFRIVVGGRGSVFYTALTINCACEEEHSFNQRGLSFSAVSEYGDISNVLSLIVLHSVIPLSFPITKIMCLYGHTIIYLIL